MNFSLKDETGSGARERVRDGRRGGREGRTVEEKEEGDGATSLSRKT